jgi:hypothetical protein
MILWLWLWWLLVATNIGYLLIPVYVEIFSNCFVHIPKYYVINGSCLPRWNCAIHYKNGGHKTQSWLNPFSYAVSTSTTGTACHAVTAHRSLVFTLWDIRRLQLTCFHHHHSQIVRGGLGVPKFQYKMLPQTTNRIWCIITKILQKWYSTSVNCLKPRAKGCEYWAKFPLVTQ